MEILASGIDHKLEEIYEEWQEKWGFGPCGAYAALRRKQGWGDIAICNAKIADGTEFPHYVIVQDGAIIDLANPLGETLTYEGIEILDDDEMPEVTDSETIDWLEARM